MIRIDWTFWDNELGTVPDRVISEASGISIASVCYRRQRLEIPAYRKSLSPSPPANK